MTVTADPVMRPVMLVTGETNAPIDAAPAVVDQATPETVTPQPVKVVTLVTMETHVSTNATVTVVGLSKLVILFLEHVIVVTQGSMGLLVQIAAIPSVLDHTTNVAVKMEFVTQVAMLDITEIHASFAAAG